MQEACLRLSAGGARAGKANVDGPGVVVMSISLEEVERVGDDWQVAVKSVCDSGSPAASDKMR